MVTVVRSAAAAALCALLCFVGAPVALAAGDQLPPSDPTVGWPDPVAGTALIPDPAGVPELESQVWTSTWNDIHFDLRPDGTFVAAYEFDSGVIVGRIQGENLVGWWCEQPTAQIPRDAGEVQFRVLRGPEGPFIQGRWSFGMHAADDDTWGTWDAAPLGEGAPASLQNRAATAEQFCASPLALGALPSAPMTIDTPSTLSGLTTLQAVTPVAVAAAGGGAVVLVAVAAYPAILLDGTLSANRNRLFGWAKAPAQRVRQSSAALRRRVPAWLGAAAGLVATVLLSGFIEPRYGFNGGSARLLISLALSIVVERLAFLLIVRRIVRRRAPQLAPVIRFAASSLVFVAVAVLLTRITGFEPGIVFGLVLGLAVASDLQKVGEARLALAASAWALSLGLVGWLLYSLLVRLLGPDPGVWGLFAIETLAGFAVSGIAALPIALLPLAVLDGGAIWAWRKVVWVVAYVIGLAAFLVVVLPMPASWDEVGSSWIGWIALYSGFCGLAIGVWALFRFVVKQNPSTGVGAGVPGEGRLDRDPPAQPAG